MSETCFHCSLPIPAGSRFGVTLDGVFRQMCCPGCVAVAEIILSTGLDQYYRYRNEPAPSLRDQTLPDAEELARYDRPALQKIFVRREGELRFITLAIDGLRCAACVWLIEQHLRRQNGVVDIAVSLTAQRAELTWNEAATRLSTVLGALARIGYRAYPYQPALQESARQAEHRDALKRLAVAGLGMMQVMMFAVGLYAGAIQGIADNYRDFFRWVSAIMCAPVVGYAALPFFSGAWRDLRRLRAGMDVPIALAIGGTYAASLAAAATRRGDVYFESIAMFVFLILLGRFLEMRGRHRAARSVEGALRSTPKWALRLDANGSQAVSVYELEIGDRVLVKPGESFPADGCVVDGSGWVNEAMLTGEQWPRAKGVGDPVVGGTQNGESPLTFVVERVGAETTLSSIVRLVDRAARERPAIAEVADRVARVFVPVVIVLAILVGAIWWQIDSSRALWVTLSVLVVSCPCALSLATPAALTTATGQLLRRGLLVTRAHVLEGLARATHVVLDKTGTLTAGRFQLQRVAPFGAASAADCLNLARQLESYSEHPIAKAFAGASGDPAANLSNVRAVVARGIEAKANGVVVRIGAAEWVADLWKPAPAMSFDSPAAGGSGVLLGSSSGPLCWFELNDAPRPQAARTLQRLRDLGLELHVVSGDDAVAVEKLARQLGIRHAVGRALPQDKLEYVRALQRDGAVVIMVGDGVNDSPGLGGAQVSLALGSGTDIAMTAADSVLMRDDLEVVAEAILTARRTRSIIVQNLAWAVAYNVVALPLAACGFVAPYWAAFGMSLSSLIVVTNALRLGRSRGDGSMQVSRPLWTAQRIEEGA
ncbi:MAG: heavy metal translocating P-type ATPase [Deltaproteobacteria bacterium]|nr:heavy metal translocating P-type ATPase [Deltaproteobacteria bacterium]